ncbi:MAG: XdhC family protein [Candidatus Humimicrobiaceae bacterium]
MLEVYQEIINVISRGERAALATIIIANGSVPREVGAKMLIREDGSFIGTVGGGGAELNTIDTALEVIRQGKPRLLHFDMSGKGEKASMICGGQLDVLIEPILPVETLYLFGAGHISVITARIAKMMSFRIVVIDPRPDYNNKDRFPDAELHIVNEYKDAFPKLTIKSDSYIVIFTTGHVFDEICLNFAVGTDARYIGMIGSKKKVADVKERLLKKGISQKRLEQVYSPIGIEIGAQTPAEIAISIFAEIVKVKRLGDQVNTGLKTKIDIQSNL